MTATTSVHPFEKAKLGKAPFRVVGFEQRRYKASPGSPSQPGAACDFCGTGIVDVYIIKGTDNKPFIVGCECVRKTGDVVLTKQTKEAKKEHKRKLKREALEAEAFNHKQTATDLLATDEVKELLNSIPHINAWHAEQGKSKLDYINWLMAASKYKSAVDSIMSALATEPRFIKELQERHAAVVEAIRLKKEAQEADAKRRAGSVFVGTVGDKLKQVRVRIDFAKTLERSDYDRRRSMPSRRIVKLVNAEGNTLITIGSGNTLWDFDANEEVLVSGTIQEHQEYNGEKQTKLTRVKLEDVAVA